MKNIIITKELSNTDLCYPKGIILNAKNVDLCIDSLKALNKREITIYDIVYNRNYVKNTQFNINDHINCTGDNPLIGRQLALGIDFVDMTEVYSYNKEGVVAHSCGEKINLNHEYPCAFLAHIVIMFRALKFNKINAILINKGI